jgi:hypothetical protein
VRPVPINVEHVLRVVDQIIPLLASHGHPDKAEWLAQESATLRGPEVSDSTVRESLVKLHGVIPRMGGLMDLSLVGSSAEEADARQALDRLGEELYELTR